MASDSGLPGPLELLVVQPTPFCNINCSYCYLADRQSTRRMSAKTLEQTFAWVFASGLVRAPFTLLWHAGEPLVVPREFYRTAVALLERYNRPPVAIHHALQTNATLIDEDWCRLFLEHDIHPGVSVDGPAFLHDRHRRTRQGQGTHDRVLRGMRLLREHGVPFYVITVLTAEALLFYAPGIVGYSIVKIAAPTFYSLKDARTPVIVGVISVLTNLFLNLWLNSLMGFRGLALGTAIAANVNAVLLLVLLSRRLGGIDGARVGRSLLKISIASAIMGLAAFYTEAWLHGALPAHMLGAAIVPRVLRVIGAIGAGLGVLALAAWVLHIDEFRQAMRRLLSRVGV